MPALLTSSVTSAKACLHRADHFVHGGSVGNVGSKAHGLMPLGKQLIAQLLGLIPALDVIYAHGVAAPGK